MVICVISPLVRYYRKIMGFKPETTVDHLNMVRSLRKMKLIILGTRLENRSKIVTSNFTLCILQLNK